MDAKPLTSEKIALTEKKMEMALDDIIKMSKKNTFKGKKPPRTSNKSRGFMKGGSSQPKSSKVQSFLESRSSIRQGILAQRRTNLQGNQFPLTTEVARKAAAALIRTRATNRNKPRIGIVQKVGEGRVVAKDKAVSKPRQTLDARFADMQRTRVISQQIPRGGVNGNAFRGRGQQHQQRQQQWQQWQPRGRGGAAPGRRVGNFRR